MRRLCWSIDHSAHPCSILETIMQILVRLCLCQNLLGEFGFGLYMSYIILTLHISLMELLSIFTTTAKHTKTGIKLLNSYLKYFSIWCIFNEIHSLLSNLSVPHTDWIGSEYFHKNCHSPRDRLLVYQLV
jgi:hypothetical protein